MKPLPVTPDLLNVARRVVWFKEPEQTLSDPLHFLAHAMTYGTIADLNTLRAYVDDTDLCEALQNAPAGIFDDRSWAYWNLKCGREPHPLPTRF